MLLWMEYPNTQLWNPRYSRYYRYYKFANRNYNCVNSAQKCSSHGLSRLLVMLGLFSMMFRKILITAV